MPVADNLTRIEHGRYFADVLQATSDTGAFWYYVVQRKGSKDIVALVTFENFEHAVEAARRALANLNQAAAAAE